MRYLVFKRDNSVHNISMKMNKKRQPFLCILIRNTSNDAQCILGTFKIKAAFDTTSTNKRKV